VRDVQDQTLSEFARGHQGLELRVPYLDQTIWFVPSGEFAAQLVREGVGRGRIWTARELKDLATDPTLSRPDLERIVRLKNALGGEIVAVTSDPDSSAAPRHAVGGEGPADHD
jgi:hypothetical protein